MLAWRSGGGWQGGGAEAGRDEGRRRARMRGGRPGGGAEAGREKGRRCGEQLSSECTLQQKLTNM